MNEIFVNEEIMTRKILTRKSLAKSIILSVIRNLYIFKKNVKLTMAALINLKPIAICSAQRSRKSGTLNYRKEKDDREKKINMARLITNRQCLISYTYK